MQVDTKFWKFVPLNLYVPIDQKGLIILPTAGGVLADFWVPNEIDSLNCQHMLLFSFREASQNLSLLRQLFFIVSNAEKPMYSYGIFSAFFLWSPLGNYEKKSCLNKLKFGEASRNQKRSIC